MLTKQHSLFFKERKGEPMLKGKRWLLIVICVILLLSGTASFAVNGDFSDAAEGELSFTAPKDTKQLTRITLPENLNADNALTVPGKLVVKFKDGNVAVHTKALQSVGNNIIESFDKEVSNDIALITLSETADIEEAIKLISKQPGVEFVEPLYIYKAFGFKSEQLQTVTEAVYETVTDAVYGPDDPYYQKKWQWGLQAINVEEIWNRVPAEKRSNVTIAVVDTGVDKDHPDLKDNLIEGYDFVNNDTDPDDDNGHGTHVAGIAAAITNNGIGIAGVAGGAKIMPVKVLSAEGSGTSLQVYLGIVYAAKHGADVINLSLGASAPSQLIKEAIEYAVKNDVVVVAATGNDYSDEVGFPAAFDGVIGVGAVDYYYGNVFELAAFSNYGPETDIVAPGVDILSTYPIELDTFDGKQDGYTLLDGTSMATPFVAGMAALLKAENPDLTSEGIQKKLQETAYDIYDDGWDIYTGAGVVNGSTGEARIPDIFEFPSITTYAYKVSNTTYFVFVDVEKAKGIIDDSFNGDINVNIYQYLSNPIYGYYFYIRSANSDEAEIQADYKSMAETQNSFTVPVENGEGYEIYTFNNSGFYNFVVDGETAPEEYLTVNSNTVYRVLNNDAKVTGTIHLEKPFENDTIVLIYALNEIYSLYVDAGLAYPTILTIPAGTVDYPYSLYLPRDINYKIYYGIYDDNDTYYNYGFYKDSGTAYDPADFTPIDLTKGDAVNIDLYIKTVEDLDDDVGDTREAAMEISLDELNPENTFEQTFSLEYKGDRDFFKVEIKESGDYLVNAIPYQDQTPRVTVYDTSKNIIASDIYGVVQTLTPGIYYIKVEDETGLETGDYDLIFGIISQEPVDSEPVAIEFEDENLENAIREYLGKSVSEAVYSNEVVSIGKLDLSNLNISSLKGLEYFSGLWCLELGRNNISDLSPLQKLYNLEILDLSENNITDLSPLSNLYMLWELDASENKISALPEDLSKLTELYHLDLSDNEIADISSIAQLPGITTLFLQNNQISDIKALSGLETLKVLYLSGNPIADYSPIKSYYLKLADKDFYALPVAENVKISGSNKVGSKLTGSYEYSNMNGHPESGTTFIWLRSNSKDGEYTAIEGATEITYTLTQSDVGKYIKFEVTPGADGVPSKGLPAASEPFGPIEKAGTSGDDDSGSGSSPSSGSKSGATPTPKPTQAPNQTPVIEIKTDENGKTVLIADATNIQLSWDTAPVIDATAESHADIAEIKIAADIFRDSLKNNQPISIRLNNVVFTIQPGTISFPDEAEIITLKIVCLSADELPEELKPSDAVSASLVYDIQITVDGKAVTSFNKPVAVTIPLDSSKVTNSDKVGVYYANSTKDSKWTFIGGKVANNAVTFATDHFSLFHAMESTKTFSDIKDHWAKEDIEIMAARHVTQGTGDNKFSPDANITRAEFTAMIVRALNISEKNTGNPFNDVKSGDWFADAAFRANAAGIIQGDANGSFLPGNMISREEMAAIAVRAYSYYSGERTDKIITTQEIRFTDMDNASEWARKYITLADALGLMNGLPDRTFRPKNYCTRAEAIVVVKRLMKLLEIF